MAHFIFILWTSFIFLIFSHTQLIKPVKKNSVLINIEISNFEKKVTKPINNSKKQIVQTKLFEKKPKPQDDAYFGQQNQSIDRETVSKKKLTQIGTEPQNKSDHNLKSHSLNKSMALSKLGIKLNDPAKKSSSDHSSFADSNVYSSDYIQGLKEGETTALNTKEYIFYSYFQRIRKQLDLAWTRSLRSNLINLYKNGRSLSKDVNHITKVIVTLSNQGEIKSVQFVEESGIYDLDSAAVKAFNQAGPFPNPPKGLIDSKNEIKINWIFILKT